LARRGGQRVVKLRLGSAELVAARRVLTGPAGEVELTAREYALASELFGHPGDVLTRSRLLQAVWGTDFDRTHNIVDVYIGYLRQKLAQAGVLDAEIAAVRSMGYRLVARDAAK
jgi:DNA-binding response OmpR family regulator